MSTGTKGHSFEKYKLLRIKVFYLAISTLLLVSHDIIIAFQDYRELTLECEGIVNILFCIASTGTEHIDCVEVAYCLLSSSMPFYPLCPHLNNIRLTHMILMSWCISNPWTDRILDWQIDMTENITFQYTTYVGDEKYYNNNAFQ